MSCWPVRKVHDSPLLTWPVSTAATTRPQQIDHRRQTYPTAFSVPQFIVYDGIINDQKET